MSKHIHNLIQQGEHQRLDFKYEITDSKKIARSLVAFANTDGGTLLVGVKDNGAVAGIRTDEEIYMVEGAASLFCRPEVPISTREWDVNGKKVLEVIVPKSDTRPHQAPSKDGQYRVFIRVADQNLLANKVLLKVWKRQDRGTGVTIRYREIEKLLLDYLQENRKITLSKFCRIAGISYYKAETILVNFILLNIVEMVIGEKETFYRVKGNGER